MTYVINNYFAMNFNVENVLTVTNSSTEKKIREEIIKLFFLLHTNLRFIFSLLRPSSEF